MKTIQNDIKNNNFKPLYLLYGEEGYLLKHFKDELIKAIIGDNEFNLKIVREKPDWEDISFFSETPPFMSEYRLIVFDRCNLLKKKNEKAECFFSSKLPQYLIIVVIEDSIDKRLSLYNTFKKNAYICELGIQSQSDVEKYIKDKCMREGTVIDKEAATDIYVRTLGDLGMVSGELEKLIAYTGERKKITSDDVRKVCSVRIESRVFEMIEYIAYKNRRKAFALYFDLLAAKEAPMKIFVLMEKHFYGLFQTSVCQSSSSGEISRRIGVAPFVAGKYLKQVKGFTTDRLKKIVKSFLITEEDIKNGKISDRTGLELMIAEVMQ